MTGCKQKLSCRGFPLMLHNRLLSRMALSGVLFTDEK